MATISSKTMKCREGGDDDAMMQQLLLASSADDKALALFMSSRLLCYWLSLALGARQPS
jgi:hypothetical protein